MYYIIDVLNETHLNKLRRYFDFATFSQGLWAGTKLESRIKNNLETIGDGDKKRYDAEVVVEEALKSNPDFNGYIFPKTMSLVNFGRYTEGMFYAYHNDNSFMPSMDRKFEIRTDYSCTLFISDPEDYDGGELVVKVGNVEQSFKLKAGQAIFYPTEYLHKVNEVTRGKRDVAVFWVESKLRNKTIATVMADMYDINKTYSTIFTDEHSEYDVLRNKLSHIQYQLKREFITK